MSITDWPKFWAKVQSEFQPAKPDAGTNGWTHQQLQSLWSSLGLVNRPASLVSGNKPVSEQLWIVASQVQPPTIASGEQGFILDKSIEASEQSDNRSQSFDPSILWDPLTYSGRVQQRSDNLRWRQQIIDALNKECLSNPDFSEHCVEFSSSNPVVSHDTIQQKALDKLKEIRKETKEELKSFPKELKPEGYENTVPTLREAVIWCRSHRDHVDADAELKQLAQQN